MLRIATFIDLRDQMHSLGLYCVTCERWGEADLNLLIETGRGHSQLTETRFRCTECGELVEKQLRPPVPEIGNANAYI